MSDTQRVSSGGVGFTGLLTLVFIAAKLFGKIDWSWFWVFSPLYIGFAVAVAIILVCALVVGIAAIADAVSRALRDRRARRARRSRNAKP